MTDITELAQSLKAAAEKATQGNWRAFQYHDGRCGIGGGHNDEIMVCEHISKERPHDAMFIALANPANVLALVEALEKAQQHIARQEQILLNQDESLSICRGELEAAHQHIAELESRTVKLPDLRQIVSGDRYVWSDGVYNYSQDVKVALAAAGIKVEAE
ncbi:hypothetical protein L393_00850 [Klebsiella pneumoniae MGH 47]|uniref:ead/Ea22-like family protein n=1 Tax=Klebsiella pneumoniae TaxID=573 RepID=UPI00044BC2CC|nr:ead/Ea22-like family protein [Klebsiella pneumoniae]EWF53087.1 hypothetical protein L393_00850 [Klebsiella pneumoniae MGH 47]